jgi:hypothetical protein
MFCFLLRLFRPLKMALAAFLGNVIALNYSIAVIVNLSNFVNYSIEAVIKWYPDDTDLIYVKTIAKSTIWSLAI